MPEQVLFTPAALEEDWGQQILSRVQALSLPIEYLPRNRLTGLRGEDERETYQIAKRTLAIVIALRGRSRTYSREEDRKKRTTNVIPL